MHPSEIEKNIANAVNLENEGRASECLALLELIRPHMPNSPVLLHMRIRTLFSLGRHPEAQHDCERLLHRLDQLRIAISQLESLLVKDQVVALASLLDSQSSETTSLKARLDEHTADALDKETLQSTVTQLEERLQQLLSQQEQAATEQSALLSELTQLREKERSTTEALEKAYTDLDEMKLSLLEREAEVADAETELEKKAQHVSQLESEVRTLQERSDSAVETEELLNLELARLKEQGDAKSEELEQARSELTQLQASLSEREEAISAAQENNRKHEEALESMRLELTAIHEEADKAADARETLKAELAHLRQAEQSKSEALESARTKLSELEQTLATREQSVAEAEARARENEQEIARVREELNDTLQKASEAERSEAALAEEVAQLRDNESAKAAALQQTRQEMESLRLSLAERESLLAAEAQKSELSSEALRDLRSEMEEMSKRAATIAQSEQHLSAELETLRKNEEEKSRILDGTRSEMDALRTQMAQQQQAVLSAEEISSQHDAIVQSLQAELQALQAQATTASSSEQELAREVEQLRANESSKTQALADAQEEMDALRQQLSLRESDAQEAERLTAQKQQELEGLRKELSDLQTKTAQTLDVESVLADEMAKLRQNEALKNAELEKSRLELEELKIVLKSREEDAAKASSEQEQSRATIQQLENELAALRHENMEQQSSQQALQAELSQIHDAAERQGMLKASPQAEQLKKIQEQLLTLGAAHRDAQQTIREQATQSILDEPSQGQTGKLAQELAVGSQPGNQLFALNYALAAGSQKGTQSDAQRLAKEQSQRQTQQQAADIFSGLQTVTSAPGIPGISPAAPTDSASEPPGITPLHTPLASEAGIPGLTPLAPSGRPHSDSDDVGNAFEEMYPKPRDVSFVFPDQSVSIAVPRRRRATPVLFAAMALLIVAIAGIGGFIALRYLPKELEGGETVSSESTTASGEEKLLTMEFPADRVFGTLYDPNLQPASEAEWPPYAPAQGVIEYPAGTRFHLVVRKDQVHDLSPLVPLPYGVIASLWLPDLDMNAENLNYLHNLEGVSIVYIDQELTEAQREVIMKGFKRQIRLGSRQPGTIVRDITPPEERVLEFPQEYSLGRVAIRRWNEALQPWQFLDMAQGSVTIPAKMEVQIEITQVEFDLEALTQLDEMAIHTLLLKGKTVTDDSLEGVGHLRGLVALEFEDTEVTDAGMEKILQVTGLQQIRLENTAITDESIKLFPNFLQLSKVDITNAPGVTAESLPVLRSILALRRLNLEKTGVSHEQLRQFAQDMASCSVTPI
ncbi:MAG: hypothetical protein GX130_08980 [Candidatus Hydrogenedens sp.]|nr:hypothetical protein [Candidatus Hydrogenedens sp.]